MNADMPSDDLYVVGINAYDHDVSACLLRNGEIVVAIAKERLTRIKHDTGFYQDPVDYCLDVAGIDLDRVDLVVRNSYVLPVGRMERTLAHHDTPGYMSRRDLEQAEEHPLWLTDSERVVTVSHHLAHAYSAFAVCPFDEGAVMVVDGVGSYREDVTEPVPESDDAHGLAREAESYYRFRGTEIEPVRKVFMGPVPGFLSDDFFNMPGLGALYSRVSLYVFEHWNQCGEVMGLASYGRADRVKPMMWLEDGELVVPEWDEQFRHSFMRHRGGDWDSSPWRGEWEDLTARVQADAEDVLLERARWLHETTGAANLVMAGGVALNCVANGRIVRETPFTNVWIQPAAGDDGIAIGAAYYGHLALRNGRRTFEMRTACLGREYGAAEVEEAVRPLAARIATKRARPSDIARATARQIATGKVVGWFQGGSEFGPRALGNRSILADPRTAAMKDHVNARVKFRQEFRPFAPAVLAERAGEIFEEHHESPFMLTAERVRPEWRDRIAATVHVDGTARVQTVREEDNPRFHAVIRAFADLTGVPVLLNTSFNIRGEPIVETPIDAMDCYLGTGIDVLVMNDLMIEKTATFRLLGPFVRFLSRWRRNVRSEAWMERLAEGYLSGQSQG